MVGRQPYVPATFTPGEIPGTHFHRLSRPQGTWFLSEGTTEKIPSDTGNRSRAVRLVAQRLNHYATPRPLTERVRSEFYKQFGRHLLGLLWEKGNIIILSLLEVPLDRF
jgi:hypothetical protein